MKVKLDCRAITDYYLWPFAVPLADSFKTGPLADKDLFSNAYCPWIRQHVTPSEARSPAKRMESPEPAQIIEDYGHQVYQTLYSHVRLPYEE